MLNTTIPSSIVVDKEAGTVTCTGQMSYHRAYEVVLRLNAYADFKVDGELMRNPTDHSEALRLSMTQVLATLLAK